MQAARVHPKRKTFVLEDVPVPEIGPGEVLVKVHAAGLSRGLISVLLFTDMIKLLPATLGHEIAGVVAATGPGVSGFLSDGPVWHRIASNSTPIACRLSSVCGHSTTSLRFVTSTTLPPSECTVCVNPGAPGIAAAAFWLTHAVQLPGENPTPSPAEGGSSNRAKARHIRKTLQLRNSILASAAGCKISTAAISWKAVSLARSTAPGGTLLVTGASGANGSLAVACAALAGFDRVIAVAAHRGPLDRLARMFPRVTTIATEELDPEWEKKGQLTERLREVTGGVDAIVDFTPIGPAVAAQCLPVLNRSGRAVFMAGNPSLIEVSYLDIMTRENLVVLLQSTGKKLEECEGECEVDTGRRIGADQIISGEIQKVGTKYKMTLRLHDTREGRLLASTQASGKTIEELDSTAQAAAEKLLAAR